MKKLNIAYFGSPYFSALFLEKLLTDTSIKRLIEVKLVITQPDKPLGKRQILTPTPVKEIAKKHNIEVFDKENLSILPQYLKKLKIGLGILFAYGFKKFLQKDLLSAPKLRLGNMSYGFINVHPSVLPKYRGASPIVYPLILGDAKTGVTLFVMDEKMDHGPILAQEELPILPNDKRPDLEIKLMNLAFELFRKTISKLISANFSQLNLIQQNHELATYAPYLSKDDGYIQLSTLKKTLAGKPLLYEELPAIIKEYTARTKRDTVHLGHVVYNMFRGLYPWPGIWTSVNIEGRKKRLKLTNLTINNLPAGRQGQQLTINSVQLEGKKEVDFRLFQKAYKIFNVQLNKNNETKK